MTAEGRHDHLSDFGKFNEKKVKKVFPGSITITDSMNANEISDEGEE
jgi:hypothetical protein